MLYEKIKSDGPTETWETLPHAKMDRLGAEVRRRHAYIEKYGFSVPTKEAVANIAAIANGEPILEVGAGLGMWSALLHQENAKAICTDKGNPKYTFKRSPPWCTSEQLDAEDAVKKYWEAKVLLCSWPCYDESWFAEACKQFKGKYIIHIGEGYGGCTADDAFFELMDKEWDEIDTLRIPRWVGVNDRVHIHSRKALVC